MAFFAIVFTYLGGELINNFFQNIINFLTNAFRSIITHQVAYYYRLAPKQLGGWAGTADADICASITNVPSVHWLKDDETTYQCIELINRNIDSYVIVASWTIFLLCVFKPPDWATELIKGFFNPVKETNTKTRSMTEAQKEKAKNARQNTEFIKNYNPMVLPLIYNMIDDLDLTVEKYLVKNINLLQMIETYLSKQEIRDERMEELIFKSKFFSSSKKSSKKRSSSPKQKTEVTILPSDRMLVYVKMLKVGLPDYSIAKKMVDDKFVATEEEALVKLNATKQQLVKSPLAKKSN